MLTVNCQSRSEFSARPTKRFGRRPTVVSTPNPMEIYSQPSSDHPFIRQLAVSLGYFTMEFLINIHGERNSDNYAISAFEIFNVLSIISEGASGNTLEQLKAKMNWNSLNEK